MSSTENILKTISSQLDLSGEKVALLNNAFVAELESAASNLDTVAIPGFGTFEGEKTPERVSADGNGGGRILMPPRIDLKFKSSVVLRKKLNG